MNRQDFLKLHPEIKDNKVPVGLGDVVERIAQPIAGVIDKVLGTKIKECGRCKKRKEALNNLMPDVKRII